MPRSTTRSSRRSKGYLPYLILIVELDTQIGVPTEHDGLRVAGNLATPDGDGRASCQSSLSHRQPEAIEAQTEGATPTEKSGIFGGGKP
jgi:hypothetical protein